MAQPAEPEETAPFFHDVEPVTRLREDLLDVHVRADHAGRRPAVIFIHGGPVPETHTPRPRDSALFRGYGALAAHAGLVGVTFDHPLHTDEHYPRSAAALDAVVARTRTLGQVDPDRIVLWFFCGGSPLAAAWLREPPSWLRGIAWTYPVLAPPPDWPGDAPRFNAVEAVGEHPALPKLLVRVGHEIPFIAGTQDAFVDAADAAGAALEVVTIEHAVHGFEVHPYDAEARAVVDGAIAWVAATALAPR
ncbi:alpha/beta hydrolase family protein [Actinomycetospora sp. C-140]